MQEPRGIHTEVLAYEIEAYLNDVDSQFYIPPALDRNLLKHLVEAWSVMQERAFSRYTTHMPVRVAVGLRATHYFLSGGCDFTDQLANTDGARLAAVFTMDAPSVDTFGQNDLPIINSLEFLPGNEVASGTPSPATSKAKVADSEAQKKTAMN